MTTRYTKYFLVFIVAIILAATTYWRFDTQSMAGVQLPIGWQITQQASNECGFQDFRVQDSGWPLAEKRGTEACQNSRNNLAVILNFAIIASVYILTAVLIIYLVQKLINHKGNNDKANPA